MQYRLVSMPTSNQSGFAKSFPNRESMLDHAITLIASLGNDKFTLDRDYPDVKIATSYRVWHYRKIES